MNKRIHIALVYNAMLPAETENPEDRGSVNDLRKAMQHMARVLRKLGHKVTLVPLAQELLSFQRKLQRLKPDVVFNQYEDIVHGALYEMRLAALVRMMGFPMTGSPALALGLCRYKYMTASLLQGAGIAIPPDTFVLERMGDADAHRWHFPIIIQPAQEDAGIGLDRESVVYSKRALKGKLRHILSEFHQPALAQKFLKGREFNVGIVGGRRLRVMPLAEVDYSRLPSEVPPIMSYAAKWMENTVEYKSTRVVCPAEVEPELARRISMTALRAFRAVGGWGYGRVDIRLDETDVPRVLEVNCNPSLDEDVALARAAARAGINYPRLLQMILQSALEEQPFDASLPMW